MSCCSRTNGIPGTPTLSSGLTQQAAAAAARADQARVLASLQNQGSCGCPGVQSNKGAYFASILEDDHATRCQPGPVVQAYLFPRAGTTENIRIQKKMDSLLTCATDPMDPATRYPLYRRFVPQAPCPPPTAEQLNSTQPKPSFTICQPPRF
jgi:hypothetical protein